MKEFLKLDNKLVLNLRIKPISPLTIKLGKNTKEDNSSDTISVILTTESMTSDDVIVETGEIKLDKRKGEMYIPGSTLKGLFRDRFITMADDIEDNSIKNLFGYSEEENSLKGRIFLQDAYVADENLRREIYEGAKSISDFTKTRSITPIDHFSSKAKVPLKYEYVVNEFLTEVVVNNITLDELQKIYFILRDSQNGEIRIGNSKTRGFGQIVFEIDNFRFENYIGKNQFFKSLKKFFIRNEKKSTKIGNTYLCEIFELENKYKKIDIEAPNEFIVELFSEVK